MTVTRKGTTPSHRWKNCLRISRPLSTIEDRDMTTVAIGIATRDEINAPFIGLADVHALLAVGLIERDEPGFRFPYDAVRVDFVLKAA